MPCLSVWRRKSLLAGGRRLFFRNRSVNYFSVISRIVLEQNFPDIRAEWGIIAADELIDELLEWLVPDRGLVWPNRAENFPVI
jgi:hypothetical protein